MIHNIKCFVYNVVPKNNFPIYNVCILICYPLTISMNFPFYLRFLICENFFGKQSRELGKDQKSLYFPRGNIAEPQTMKMTEKTWEYCTQTPLCNQLSQTNRVNNVALQKKHLSQYLPGGSKILPQTLPVYAICVYLPSIRGRSIGMSLDGLESVGVGGLNISRLSGYAGGVPQRLLLRSLIGLS